MFGLHALLGLKGVFAEKRVEKGCSSMQNSRPINPNYAWDKPIIWHAGVTSSAGVKTLKWKEEEEMRCLSVSIWQALAQKKLLTSFLGARNESSYSLKGDSWWAIFSSQCYPHFLKSWNNKMRGNLSLVLGRGMDWCMIGRGRNSSWQVAGPGTGKYHGYWSSELTLDLAVHPGWQLSGFSNSLQQKKQTDNQTKTQLHKVSLQLYFRHIPPPPGEGEADINFKIPLNVNCILVAASCILAGESCTGVTLQ